MNEISAIRIEKMIYVIREQKVMLDSDLAELYGVETGTLKRSVRRNIERFPTDFMFELTREEFANLRCQIGISSSGYGGTRYLPFAFTEQGVAMLSTVLGSPRAIQVNIGIIRTFVRLRQILVQESLSDRVAKLEKGTDKLFRVVFQRLETLERATPLLPPKRRKIGF